MGKMPIGCGKKEWIPKSFNKVGIKKQNKLIMEKKIISNFQKFECSVTELDKIRGGKAIEESVYSGSGIFGDICGNGEYGPNTNCCIQEFMDIYDDDTWVVWFVPCD